MTGALPQEDPAAEPTSRPEAVTRLYHERALEMTRLAVVMLGDRAAAEDVVQEAFCGLFRRWHALSDPAKAVPYLRSSVLNGSRSALRRRRPHVSGDGLADPGWGEAESAEARVMVDEEHRQVLAALKRLPARQREALLLRFYLELSPGEIALTMRISAGTVKSTTARGLAALGRLIEETP